MLLKNICNSFPTLAYLVNKLNIQSPIGLKYLHNTRFITNEDLLNDEFEKIESMLNVLSANTAIFNTFGMKLCRVRDINGTVNSLTGNNILNDIELFEIKSFCLLVQEIEEVYNSININVIEIPKVDEIVKILDPDDTKIPGFFIYDSYSEKLAQIRKEIKKVTEEGDRDKEEQLRYEESVEEDEIRAILSQKLKAFHKTLVSAINEICKLDILLAKAQQAFEMGLVKPLIVKREENTEYKLLFNPQIKEALKKKGQKYQAIDIDLFKAPCLITGANMSGKTVLLKTIALAQYLTQFAFFVPAKEAKVALVDNIMICMDESDNDLNGLSSFAAEILKINEIITQIKEKKNALVLVDELARTTNPTEGRKIVSATLQYLDNYAIRGLITSHYGDIEYKTRRLRVRGLENIKDSTSLTVDNINSFIDYSLVETNDNEVPREAIRIATLLGVDSDFINLCNKY